MSSTDPDAGNDIYRFGRGDGQDVVMDYDSRANRVDTIQFAADILPDDILLARHQEDLVLRISGTSDQITVQNYFLSSAYQIEQLQFADGTIWKKTAIDAWLASNNANVPTEGADTLLGTAANDMLAALGGDDTVSGSVGDDTLDGGAGNDSLFGNADNDVLYGQDGADWLSGSDGQDVLNGGTGADTMEGGTGDDTYIVDDAADRAIEGLEAGTDTVYSSVTYALTPASHIEQLILTGTAAINGNGNEWNNILTGNSAQNRLWGGAGADTLLGGLGDDIYVVDNPGDNVIENVGEGTDTVESFVSYTLGTNVEHLTLSLFATEAPINGTGNALDNILKGNSVANILTGDAGNDTLDGGLGADTLVGGTGDDVYVVGQTGDVVSEAANEGTDTVRSAITYTLGVNVEHLTLTGTANINGTGNTLANMLTGNSGRNTLTGNAGSDTLDGAGGDDTLTGGTGSDVYHFGSGGGQDTISENDATAGNSDRVNIGLDPLRLMFSRPTGTNNLLITLQGTTDTLTVQSWYSGTSRQTEMFQAQDGRTLLNTQVAQLIQAMATFSANNGGISWAQAIQHRPDDVQAILAAYWQPPT